MLLLLTLLMLSCQMWTALKINFACSENVFKDFELILLLLFVTNDVVAKMEMFLRNVAIHFNSSRGGFFKCLLTLIVCDCAHFDWWKFHHFTYACMLACLRMFLSLWMSIKRFLQFQNHNFIDISQILISHFVWTTRHFRWYFDGLHCINSLCHNSFLH